MNCLHPASVQGRCVRTAPSEGAWPKCPAGWCYYEEETWEPRSEGGCLRGLLLAVGAWAVLVGLVGLVWLVAQR